MEHPAVGSCVLDHTQTPIGVVLSDPATLHAGRARAEDVLWRMLTHETNDRGHALASRLSDVILHELEATLKERRSASPDESYTARLLSDPTLNQRKIMEEAFEVCLELQSAPIDAERTAEEAADVIYHLLVALVGADVAVDDVFAVLEGRKK